MGRFDTLTQLEEKPIQDTAPVVVKEEKPRKPETPKAGNPENPKTRLSGNPKVGKPNSGFTDNPESGEPRKPAHEKPEKYTTMLKVDMIKRIKMYAVQEDIKDYEVVEKALQEYFDRKK